MATTLLLIDLQRNMLEPPEPVPVARDLIVLVHGLLERARAVGAGVVHVRNNGAEGEPDFPGTPGWELFHVPIEGEAIVDKFAADAFEETALAELIPAGSTILLAGLASDALRARDGARRAAPRLRRAADPRRARHVRRGRQDGRDDREGGRARTARGRRAARRTRQSDLPELISAL